jgi:hypothetical protein
MWKEAAELEPRGSQFPQAEAITYFARAMGSARSGDLAAADKEVGKLKELRATLERASQPYWAEQVEIQMLAASAWIAQAKGQKDEAVIIARSTSLWRTGFTPCASCWAISCWKSNSLLRH